MTPCLAIVRAPAASVTLMIAGSSSGDRPTASATANSSDSIIGRPSKLVHHQHEQNDDDHHPEQQIAELPYAAPEFGLGRARLEPRDDRAEGGPASGLDREDLRRAALHRSAEIDGVASPGERRLRRNRPGPLLDRKGFAGQAGFVDQEVRGLDHEPIGGNEIACRELDDIAGHNGARRDSLFNAGAHHTACQCASGA